MMIAGTGGSHRDGTRPYPHFLLHTRGLLLGNTGTMRRPYPARDGGFGYRKSGGSHRNPGGSHRNRKNR